MSIIGRGGARLVALGAALALAGVAAVSGVSACGASSDSFDQAFEGFHATMATYDQRGQQVDEIKGASFHVARDSEFDSTDSKGNSNNDS
jgi:hypothetical protein